MRGMDRQQRCEFHCHVCVCLKHEAGVLWTKSIITLDVRYSILIYISYVMHSGRSGPLVCFSFGRLDSHFDLCKSAPNQMVVRFPPILKPAACINLLGADHCRTQGVKAHRLPVSGASWQGIQQNNKTNNGNSKQKNAGNQLWMKMGHHSYTIIF